MTTNGNSTSATSTIFVGSSVGLEGLAQSAIAAPLIADGDVSIYGHMSGIIGTFDNNTEHSLISTWAGTGEGLVELAQDEPMAMMYVTIANTNSTSISLPIGTIVSSASGVQYQLVEMPRQEPGWSSGGSGDGSLGQYTIASGSSLTLLAQALVDGPSGNLLVNQVTQIGVAGAQITGSFLKTATDQWETGTITVVNNSSSGQIVWGGTQIVGANGSYLVGLDKGVSSFVATNGDGSAGYYYVLPGQTTTLPIYSSSPITAADENDVVIQESAEDAAAGSIISGAFNPGITLVSSSAIITQGVVNPADQDHVSDHGVDSGFFTNSQDKLFTINQGYNPTEADVDTYNDNIWTKDDLINWEAYVNNARAYGILNLAPMLSEFETVNFATSDATQYVRAGALYGGGISFDMPAWFFLAREDAYHQSTYQEIQWATANGLRSSINLSPIGANDPNFLSDTEQMIAMLKANNALPTQFVIKDEAVTGNSTIFSTSDMNSFNSVADWLSSLTLTPSNSEAGLEARGVVTSPDDLMTGVLQEESVAGSAAVQLQTLAQIFGKTTAEQATLTVTLGTVSLGTLSSPIALGSVSSDGSTFTVTGTMGQLTQALEELS
ncbi:MAG: hypothetical protein ACRYG8_18805, partial [Janthinobacterium lividum]